MQGTLTGDLDASEDKRVTISGEGKTLRISSNSVKTLSDAFAASPRSSSRTSLVKLLKMAFKTRRAGFTIQLERNNEPILTVGKQAHGFLNFPVKIHELALTRELAANVF